MGRKRQGYLHCTNHRCPCGDEDRPGWVCSECGEPTTEWMSDSDFQDYCQDNPLDDEQEYD